MRYFVFAVATATTLFAGGMLSSGSAEAAPLAAANSLRAAVDGFDMIEDAQFVYRGRRYCWYDDGWQGAGWYWCGYASRYGLGWGGGYGWHGWRGGHRGGRDLDVRRRGGQFEGQGQFQQGGQVRRDRQIQRGGQIQIQQGGQVQRDGQVQRSRQIQIQQGGQVQQGRQFQQGGQVRTKPFQQGGQGQDQGGGKQGGGR